MTGDTVNGPTPAYRVTQGRAGPAAQGARPGDTGWRGGLGARPVHDPVSESPGRGPGDLHASSGSSPGPRRATWPFRSWAPISRPGVINHSCLLAGVERMRKKCCEMPAKEASSPLAGMGVQGVRWARAWSCHLFTRTPPPNDTTREPLGSQVPLGAGWWRRAPHPAPNRCTPRPAC